MSVCIVVTPTESMYEAASFTASFKLITVSCSALSGVGDTTLWN